MAARRPRLFWIGILIYCVSFFLGAAAHRRADSRSIRGFYCAYFSFVSPLQDGPQNGSDSLYYGRDLEFFAMLISGWINPLFLIFIARVAFGSQPPSSPAPIILISLMIPCCWIVFHYEGLFPREGHALWIMGMLLVLFSSILRTRPELAQPVPAA